MRGRVLLESFIATQKLSVQKTLARKFARFVSFRRDTAELLLATLQVRRGCLFWQPPKKGPRMPGQV